MFYPHSFLWHYLWIAPHALQFVIALIMIRRKLFREFPVFFAYTVFQIVEGGTLFILDHVPAVSGYQYWHAHWVSLLISDALSFGVIWEIFSYVFRDYHGLGELTRIVFRWALVFLLFAAIAVAASAPDDDIHLLSRVHIVKLSVGVVQSGLWLLLIVFSFYLGLSRRSFAYGIALGLGIFSTVNIAIEAIRVWTGPQAGYTFDFVSMATYHCCVIVWLVYLWVPETSRRALKTLPQNNLEQWNAELQRLLQQ